MKTILLADDDASIVSVFGLALRGHGYQVIEACSGEAALELARRHLPDLILTDISMPDGDGQSLLSQIRQDPELGSMQVVLMTGQTHLVTPRKGMELGADDFLVKPVSLGDLLRCVDARFHRAQIHWRVEDRVLAKLRNSLQSTLPHELFTPLGGIIGLADILRTDLPNLSAEEIRELLDDVYNSALRLHRTLRNYLMVIDLQTHPWEAGSMTERLASEPLKDSLMSGLRASVRRHGRETDVEIRIEPGPGIVASPSDVSLIAEELIDNACKFSRKGTVVEVHFTSGGVLTIRDAGRGMTPEEINQVGSFQQFDRKKHEQQGLGLGLALVQKLAAKCGATLTLESRPTESTTARVAFRT